MNFMIDVLPGDDAEWEFGFHNWRQVRVRGETVTGGAVLGWGGAVPGTVGSPTVGTDVKSLRFPIGGFADETDYFLKASVTFSGGDVLEFDVGFRCKRADDWS